jgi:hypothetical protein
MADESPSKQPQAHQQPKAAPAAEPRAPQQQQQATADEPAREPDPQQPARKSGPAATSGNARTSGNSADLARSDETLGPISPGRARSIQLGKEAAARSGAPKIPTSKELDRIRDERFGGQPGTVRVDAPPAGSGPDAPPTKLIFFDAAGRKVGEQDYEGPDAQGEE